MPFVPDPSQSLAQVSDVRSSQSDTGTSPLARLWSGTNDTALLTYLIRASRRVEGIIGARLIPFTTVEPVQLVPYMSNPSVPPPSWDQAGVWSGFVSAFPILRPESWTGSLTSVTALDASNASTTISTSAAAFAPTLGRLLLPASVLTAATTVQVTYTGGYATVPDDLIEATILLAGDSWLVGTDSRNGQPDALDLYNRAMSILKPWTDARPSAVG